MLAVISSYKIVHIECMSKSVESAAKLEVQGLSASRGDEQLFEGLEFLLLPGEVLFIEGANGSGKTSLLYILAGLRSQDAGDLKWCDQSIEELGKDYHQQLCFVGHTNGVKAELTVFENLQGFAQLKPNTNEHSISKDNQAVVDELDLSGYEDAFCYQLSSGQQRRLGLARLINSTQPLWILDEPFTALDKKTIGFFETLITQHVNRGGMVVITSHQSLNLAGCQVKSLQLGNGRL